MFAASSGAGWPSIVARQYLWRVIVATRKLRPVASTSILAECDDSATCVTAAGAGVSATFANATPFGRGARIEFSNADAGSSVRANQYLPCLGRGRIKIGDAMRPRGS